MIARLIGLYLILGVIYVATYWYLVLVFPNSRVAKRNKTNKEELKDKHGVDIVKMAYGVSAVISSIVTVGFWPISLVKDFLPSKLDKKRAVK